MFCHKIRVLHCSIFFQKITKVKYFWIKKSSRNNAWRSQFKHIIVDLCNWWIGKLFLVYYILLISCKVNAFVFEGIVELCFSVTGGTFYKLLGEVEQAWDVHSLSKSSLSVNLPNNRWRVLNENVPMTLKGRLERRGYIMKKSQNAKDR